MKKNRVAMAAFLILVSAIGFGRTFYLLHKPAIERPRPNILIVSLCSFRLKLLRTFNPAEDKPLPAMDGFFDHSSFIFENLFNGMPWTSLVTVLSHLLPPPTMHALGYQTFSNTPNGLIFRVPHRESGQHDDSEKIEDNFFEKNHQSETNYLRSLVFQARHSLFFIFAHYKYMHYPLIDRFNADADWDFYLSQDEHARLNEYLDHPTKYPEKLPLLLLISDDVSGAYTNPLVQKMKLKRSPVNDMKLKGLLSDPKFLAQWQQSPGFKDDLLLLEKIYHANARYLDRVLAPMLDLWGDKELQENTIVILTGDHGEMHMEHGVLTHANSLFEEAIHVPLAIRLPGKSKPIRIPDQVHFETIASLIKGLMDGSVDLGNFEKSVHKIADDTVLLRDCNNTVRGLRYQNRYKYIVDIASDQRSLYDLKEDPSELSDLSAQNPDLVGQLENIFWQHYPEFSKVPPIDCRPWVHGSGG